MIDWTEPKKFIQQHRRFLLSAHQQADGDAIGSQVALARLLRKLAKEVRLLNPQPVPRIYQFLDPQRECLVHEPALTGEQLRWADAVIVVDAGSWSQLGELARAIQDCPLPSLCIDHHRTGTRFATLDAIDERACAAGEMIFELAGQLHVPIDEAAAGALFVAIATDTGWFRFSNTTPRALQVCAELVACGAQPERLYEQVYENRTQQRLRLLTLALATLTFECDGRIAWFKVTRPMYESTGADEEDLENFVDLPRCVAGVQVIVLFREGLDGMSRASLRSKSDLDVSRLAAQFGGGGHAKAAGLRMARPLDEVIREVLAAVREAIERPGG